MARAKGKVKPPVDRKAYPRHNQRMSETPAPKTATAPARLTVGSTMRHVIEMTFAGSIGLIAIFLVDFLSLFYVSLLKNEQLTAGIGYATTILFFTISVNVGLMIASSALVARALGAGDRERARRIATSAALLAAAVSALASLGVFLGMDRILGMLGSSGVPHDVAVRFLMITLPSNAAMAFGMVLSSTLRALGDARRAMLVTLLGGVATAILDPLFIFGFRLGTDGAAIATVFSRLIFCVVGWRGVVTHHKLMAKPALADIKSFAGPLAAIAVPAVLTNIATPFAAAFLLATVRPFGDEAVAAHTIIDRLVPLAFGVIFALSGAVGPILAQNLGAGHFDRIRQAMRDAMLFSVGYCLLVWAVLALGYKSIPAIFGASPVVADYVGFFCLVGAAAWVFNGLLFVANAVFNNLGFPVYSTLFNWGRATLGIIPFAMIGAKLWGFKGVVASVIGGSAIFGLAGVLVAFRLLRKMEANAARVEAVKASA